MNKILAALILSTLPFTTHAGGGGAAAGGATEWTQLMNNAELVAGVSRMSEAVAVQLEQLLVQEMQQELAKRNMDPMAKGLISQNLGAYQGMNQGYTNMYMATTALRDSSYRASGMMNGEISTMSRLNMSPQEYTNKMILLSKEQGGNYKASLDNTVAAMQDVQRRGETLTKMHAQVPGINSNIKGMQALATSNLQMTGEMQNLNMTLLQMKANSEMKTKTEADRAAVAGEFQAQHIKNLKEREVLEKQFWVKKGVTK